VPWTRHQVDPETLEVVERVGCCGDLELARVAASRIHLAHGQRAAEPAADAATQTLRRFGQAEPRVDLDLAERTLPRRWIDVE
jgi:hypothetical protein